MTFARLRVILEMGKARRVVAGATDWPGLDRWGTSEEAAITRIHDYLPRYAAVAGRAGLAADYAGAAAAPVEVVERVPGSSSTDFWGIAHVPSRFEEAPLLEEDLDRRLALLAACWAEFDAVTARVTGVLRPAGRTAGRTREQIIRHVYGTEPEQFTRKVEVRSPFELVLTSDGLAAHRRATTAAIREYHARGAAARTWPIPFLIRRLAHHVMDHAWELEDRDPGAAASGHAGRG